MRWRPILGVESILISVVSMLNEPNGDSPANLDAAVMQRDDPEGTLLYLHLRACCFSKTSLNVVCAHVLTRFFLLVYLSF